MTTETTPRKRGAQPGNHNASGGPPGNRFALKHGIFAIASMPKGANYIRRLTGALRREIEAALLAQHGEVTLTNSALAQSAARHEARALLCQRWLRLSAETMTHSERLAFVKEIGNATDRRDACLRALHLDRRDSGSILDAIADLPDYSAEPEHQDKPEDASGEAQRAQASYSSPEAAQQ